MFRNSCGLLSSLRDSVPFLGSDPGLKVLGYFMASLRDGSWDWGAMKPLPARGLKPRYSEDALTRR